MIDFPVARGALDAPRQPGVYIIRNRSSKVMYVGRTTRAKGGIHQRLRNHLAGRSVFVRELPQQADSLRKGFAFQYLPLVSDRSRALLEHLATGKLCPKHLGLGQRAEEQ